MKDLLHIHSEVFYKLTFSGWNYFGPSGTSTLMESAHGAMDLYRNLGADGSGMYFLYDVEF